MMIDSKSTVAFACQSFAFAFVSQGHLMHSCHFENLAETFAHQLFVVVELFAPDIFVAAVCFALCVSVPLAWRCIFPMHH